MPKLSSLVEFEDTLRSSDDEEPIRSYRRSTTATTFSASQEDNSDLLGRLGPQRRRQDSSDDEEEITNSKRGSEESGNRAVSQGLEDFKKMIRVVERPDDLQKLYPECLLSYQPTNTIYDEWEVFDRCLGSPHPPATDIYGEEEFCELEIRHFSIYRSIHAKNFPGQLDSLLAVNSDHSGFRYCLDGEVVHDGKVMAVGHIPIRNVVSIGNFGDIEISTARDCIWIQSRRGQQSGVWYLLKSPAKEYEGHWKKFLWLADLAKHLHDFLQHSPQSAATIGLQQMRSDFFEQLQEWHGKSPEFHEWHKESNYTTDLRKHICRFAEFLRDQVRHEHSSTGRSFSEHPLWEECAAIQVYETHNAAEPTIVTPNVAASFRECFPSWDDLDILETQEMSPQVVDRSNKRRLQTKLPDKLSICQAQNFKWNARDGKLSKASLLLESAGRKQPLQTPPDGMLGKVIIVRESKEKAGLHSTLRFAYVHEVVSQAQLRVIWLILPADAYSLCGDVCDGTFYPVGNELFFSKQCNCRPIDVKDVISVHAASIFSDRARGGDELFVSSLVFYQDGDEDVFVSQQALTDLLCDCRQPPRYRARHERCQTNDEAVPQTHAKKTRAQVKNLSLFSGCGLLDHGLGASGALETIFAIDTNEIAIRSHAANNPYEHCRYEVDSVNHHLSRLLRGIEELPIANCISAGCPCKGHSNLNNYRGNEKALRNDSLIASTMSYVELVLPEYVVVENVPQMDPIAGKEGSGNACKQAICYLVALGYQVRKKILCAPDFNGDTDRRRLFIIAAAPGFDLPDIVPASESMGTGSVGRTLRDLPSVDNDTTINIQRPDHIPMERLRQYFDYGVSLRDVVQRIPKTPIGMALVHAYEQGYLSNMQEQWFESLHEHKQAAKSRSLKRVDPGKPYRTVVTVISPLDSYFCGECIHPWEDRTISVEEVRRAQGVPDDFVLVGRKRDQIEQLGNGVVWQVARAVGEAIGASWRKAGRHLVTEDQEDETKVDVTALVVARESLMRSDRGSNDQLKEAETDETAIALDPELQLSSISREHSAHVDQQKEETSITTAIETIEISDDTDEESPPEVFEVSDDEDFNVEALRVRSIGRSSRKPHLPRSKPSLERARSKKTKKLVVRDEADTTDTDDEDLWPDKRPPSTLSRAMINEQHDKFRHGRNGSSKHAVHGKLQEKPVRRGRPPQTTLVARKRARYHIDDEEDDNYDAGKEGQEGEDDDVLLVEVRKIAKRHRDP